MLAQHRNSLINLNLRLWWEIIKHTESFHPMNNFIRRSANEASFARFKTSNKLRIDGETIRRRNKVEPSFRLNFFWCETDKVSLCVVLTSVLLQTRDWQGMTSDNDCGFGRIIHWVTVWIEKFSNFETHWQDIDKIFLKRIEKFFFWLKLLKISFKSVGI